MIVADLDDAAKMPTHIDDDAVPQALAGDARAGPARHDRNALVRRVAHEGAHVFLIARRHDAERTHLEEARVRAVHRPRQIIEQNISLDEPAQVIFDATPLLFVDYCHGMVMGGKVGPACRAGP